MKEPNRIKLTKRFIDSLTYEGDGKAHCIRWDTEIPGFGIRVFPSGVKSFIQGYRLKGRWRLNTLGQYGRITLDNARDLAKEKWLEVSQGKDPIQEKRKTRQGSVMKDLCKDFMERHAKIHKISWEQDEKRIDRVIVPKLGSRLVENITRRDIAKLHETIGESATYEANRILSLLSRIFKFAIDEGYVSTGFVNPAGHIRKYKEVKRDRWVKPDELPVLAEQIDKVENPYIRSALWLYLLCGARKNELLKAQWGDVDLQRCELRLERTKAGHIHYIHLSAPALKILQEIPRTHSSDYIFPSRSGKGHLVNIDKTWQQVRVNAQAAWKQEHGTEGPFKEIRIHDLRRTVGSWLATQGHSLLLIGRVLDHSNASTTQIYAHLSEDPLKQALDSHGEKIISIVEIARERDKKQAS